ncbi:hypothetical protein H7827_00755 [Streptomyces sp. JH002]|uniref:hypothetical protein n=1 Tax=Streptomyces sp. JH002 TaxID=2763259 RepID=UPI003D800AA5
MPGGSVQQYRLDEMALTYNRHYGELRLHDEQRIGVTVARQVQARPDSGEVRLTGHESAG